MENGFTVKIEAPELSHAILELASVLAMGVSTKAALTEASMAEPKKKKRAAKAPALELIHEDPVPKATETPSTTDAPTVVDLRAVAAEKGKSAEAKASIKALLQEFGAASISTVPEDKRAAFLAQLEAI